MAYTKRLGDGRRDNENTDCPKCPARQPYGWKPMMHIPWEGRTDIVKCWSCGHEEPRFVAPDWAAEQDLKAKLHRGSRRSKSCSCKSHGTAINAVVYYDDECPIHGLEGSDA